MKQILTFPRSTVTSHVHPYSVQCSILFLSAVFLIPAIHSKTNSGIDQDLNKQIVDQFKAKVLQHMGLSAPPQGYNTSRNSLDRKLIRDFFRKKLQASDQIESDGTDDNNNYVGEQKITVFTSTDPFVWVPVQPANLPSSTLSEIAIIKFNTHFQQPDVPYHYLVIRSAILFFNISRQKRKLHYKHKNIANVKVYLLSQSDGIHGNQATPNLIYSSTVNAPEDNPIEINITPQLLSHIVESEDKTLKFGIKIEGINEDFYGKHSKQTRKISANEMKLKISKINLEVSTLVKDLRKSRSKRHTHDRCAENMCCKHSIDIKFEDIGWNDWVLRPEGYTAYYCKGSCSDSYRMASSFTGIKNLLHDRMPEIVPAPVCAPTGYSALDMIIFDGEVKIVSYPGMVVNGCRCY